MTKSEKSERTYSMDDHLYTYLVILYLIFLYFVCVSWYFTRIALSHTEKVVYIKSGSLIFPQCLESYICDIPLSREDGLGKVYMFLRECDISMVFKQIF